MQLKADGIKETRQAKNLTGQKNPATGAESKIASFRAVMHSQHATSHVSHPSVQPNLNFDIEQSRPLPEAIRNPFTAWSPLEENARGMNGAGIKQKAHFATLS